MIKVLVSTHNFCVLNPQGNIRQQVIQFIGRLIYRNAMRNSKGQVISDNSKTFATTTKSRKEFRFHINVLEDFIAFMSDVGINVSEFNFVTVPLKEPVVIALNPNKDVVPRDNQVSVVDFIIDKEKTNCKLVPLPTGQGKTICALLGITHIPYRTIMILKLSYINRWIPDTKKVLGLEDEDILTVTGGGQLRALISRVMSGELNFKVALISNKTYQSYISEYELYGEDLLNMGYDCLPQDFFDSLGVGWRIIDEVHQDFHFNFKLDLYTNVKHSVSLSATLMNNDPFLEDMYKIAYPTKLRYQGSKIVKYVNSTAVIYTIEDGVNVRTNFRGTKSYSHIAYEESIIKNKLLLSNYLKMIDDIVFEGYIQKKSEGDKLAVFAASIDMCKKITAFLKETYPELTVEKYTAEDDYKNLIDSDIRVTTIQSGGTAHDIPNLTTVILTVSIDSIQANVQTFGRLRDLGDRQTRFYYLVNDNVKKHFMYHLNRKKMLESRAKTYRETRYASPLKGYKNR